jgi:TPR repeat protein
MANRVFRVIVVLAALVGCRGGGCDSGAEPRPMPAVQKTQDRDAVAEEPSPAASPGEDDSSAEKRFREATAKMRAGDRKGARVAFEQACGDGLARACFRIGVIYRDGDGVEADEDRARSWFEQACGLGSTSGCDALGH